MNMEFTIKQMFSTHAFSKTNIFNAQRLRSQHCGFPKINKMQQSSYSHQISPLTALIFFHSNLMKKTFKKTSYFSSLSWFSPFCIRLGIILIRQHNSTGSYVVQFLLSLWDYNFPRDLQHQLTALPGYEDRNEAECAEGFPDAQSRRKQWGWGNLKACEGEKRI